MTKESSAVSAAIAVGILVAGGVFLVLRPGLIRITFGFILLGHAVNILLIATDGTGRHQPPLTGQGALARMADPLPQAFVLTAIVISFGLTVYLLALARVSHRSGEQDTDDGPHDPGPSR